METELPLEISVADVAALRSSNEPFLLLDCREPHEYETAAIEGSCLIPMGELGARIDELDPHKEGLIIVHCHHGMRSLQVTHALRNHGIPQVQSMAGGIDQWSQEIDPNVPRY